MQSTSEPLSLAADSSMEVEVQEYMDNSICGLFENYGAASSTPAASTKQKPTGKKVLLIPDFVTNSCSSCEEEKQLASDDQTALFLKTSRGHQDLNCWRSPCPNGLGPMLESRQSLFIVGISLLTHCSCSTWSTAVTRATWYRPTPTWSSVMLYDHTSCKQQCIYYKISLTNGLESCMAQ